MPKKQAIVSTYNLSNRHAEKDSMVFGTIMAGAKANRKRLKPLKQRLKAMETPRAMCAVGAGLRGIKKTRISDVVTKSYEEKYGTGFSNKVRHQLIPVVRFAAFMGVSENYTCGVNDGFEGSQESPYFYGAVATESLDYQRGWHVGQAVAIECGF